MFKVQAKTYVLSFVIAIFCFAFAASAQLPTVFTYQGDLVLNGQPATGTFDFEFRVFTVSTGGNPVGGLQTKLGVTVTNGHFATDLDFGAIFNTGDRYLEISVRQSGQQAYTTLAPRKIFRRAPLANFANSSDTASVALSAENANNLNGLPETSFARAVGSPNYIQNTTTTQASSNFTVSDIGSANILNAFTQFNIGGQRVLSIAGASNTFVGQGAGLGNTTGFSNTIVGTFAGQTNSGGDENSFFGLGAGFSSQGNENTFIGRNSGASNISGSSNTALGAGANVGSASLSNATAIGAGSIVSSSNTVALGRSADNVIVPGDLIVGNSTAARGQMNFYSSSGNANFYMQGAGNTVGINLGTGSGAGNPFFFISHYNGTAYSDRLVITSDGTVRINVLGSAGSTSLCRNASNDISTCSSSMRYKQNVTNYRPTLNLLELLRPVAFNWTEGGTADLGLVAEEVAKIDPLLVTYNDKGEVEGVKYDRIGVVLIGTIKEQRAEIEKQRAEIERQKKRLDALTEYLCSKQPDPAICGTP